MIGRVVGGRFQLAAEAGSGGMGTVYRAHDLAAGATVAVKILNGRDTREVQRFDQEATILAGLTHPAIVRYLAHGTAEAASGSSPWSGSTGRIWHPARAGADHHP